MTFSARSFSLAAQLLGEPAVFGGVRAPRGASP